MITRLYADNFKTLVNFELPLGPMNLLARGQRFREVERSGDDPADKEFRLRRRNDAAVVPDQQSVPLGNAQSSDV